MKILITGVAGFIGSHLAQHLLKTHTILGIDNLDTYYSANLKLKNLLSIQNHPNFFFIKGSILNIEELLKPFPKPDIIIHLAGIPGIKPSLHNPLYYSENNFIGSLKVFEFAKNNSIHKIIFSSSSSVYGNNVIPFTEDQITDKQLCPYAVLKKSTELLLYSYYINFNIDVLIFRLFSIYGERQRPDLVIQKFCNLILSDQTIKIYGDGESKRDFTHINDLLVGIEKGIEYISNHNTYEILNLGNSNPVSINYLINQLEICFEKKIKLEYVDKNKEDADSTYANIDKAKKLLNYTPGISFEEGLKSFVIQKKEEFKNGNLFGI